MEFVDINFFPNQVQIHQVECFDFEETYSNSEEAKLSIRAWSETEQNNHSIQNSLHSTEIEQSENRSQTKSALHNMQKHLFTFLQSLIPRKTLINSFKVGGNSQICECIEKILEQMKNQRKKTKESLVPIFGEFNEKKIAQSKYSILVEEYTVQTLKTSLRFTKEFFLDQITSKVLTEYLEKSKMNRKRQFEEYVKSFIQEAKEERFSSRLTKHSQDQIKRLTEWTNYLN